MSPHQQKPPHQKPHHFPHRPPKRPRSAAPPSPFTPAFQTFRQTLDAHHLRHDTLLKHSRDITSLSKKAIFTLQRARRLHSPLPAPIASELSSYLPQIRALFRASAELARDQPTRYHRQLSSGIQEFLEAVLFRHYLEHRSVLTYGEARRAVLAGGDDDAGNDAAMPVLTVEDYMHAVYDFTGEAMRWAVTAVAVGEDEDDPGRVLEDLQALRGALEKVGDVGKETERKRRVMRESVEKVERAVANVVVRGSERPRGWWAGEERADNGRDDRGWGGEGFRD